MNELNNVLYISNIVQTPTLRPTLFIVWKMSHDDKIFSFRLARWKNSVNCSLAERMSELYLTICAVTVLRHKCDLYLLLRALLKGFISNTSHVLSLCNTSVSSDIKFNFKLCVLYVSQMKHHTSSIVFSVQL